MAANTHLEHLEDYVLTDIDHCINIITDISSHNVRTISTIKYDGSPAIIFGHNPDNGMFFLGTKSVFNKTPKINYSVSDILQNHSKSKGLMDKLVYIYAYLDKHKSQFPGIYQADLMCTADDIVYREEVTESDYLGRTTIAKHLNFSPNTLTYHVLNEKLIDDIKNAKMTIAVHTQYDSLTNPTPIFITGSTDAQVINDDIVMLPIQVPITNIQTNKWTYGRIIKKYQELDPVLLAEFSNTEYPELFKIFENHIIKTEGEQIKGRGTKDDQGPNSDCFLSWIIDRRVNNIKNLKTTAGKLKYHKLMHDDIEFWTRKDMQKFFNELMILRSEVISFKVSIAHVLDLTDKNFNIKAGDSKTRHEGFVVSTDSWRFKLVHREEFSRLNFLKGKYQ
ncbi:hypothetical protein NVP2275O_191 [Vibrio phage 2.275.O._10N.286.54.E11]|nr:hypothetical protein NVP2275O_191 [Vibrio phage 2.275.O._10N.286.54.E11]